MQRFLIIILVFLGIIIAAELGFLFFSRQSQSQSLNKEYFCPPSSPVSFSSLQSSSSASLQKHNLDQLQKDITERKTDVLSSVLTNTYHGKIIGISRNAGVAEKIQYPYQLWLKIQGKRGSTKTMIFNNDQIVLMQKKGFNDLSELKIGDEIKAILTYELVGDNTQSGFNLISLKIEKFNP